MNKPDGVVLHFRNVTELSEADLSKILSIRNESPVRNNMYTSHQIGADEHKSWADGLRSSPDRKFFSVEHEGSIVGAAGLSAINLAHKRADWRFIYHKPSRAAASAPLWNSSSSIWCFPLSTSRN